MRQEEGLIFDIKKLAVHDGPGIRTTVFFKGCPLHCWWCHNPEAIHPDPELVRFEAKCIGCGECFVVCPQHVHEALPDGTRAYHQERCLLCGKCVDVCYAEALVMEGRKVSVAELMTELRKDIPFYENSGGGITLSGGEPLFQHAFVLSLLRQCKAEGLHTVLDTSGQAPWAVFSEILPYVDLVLYDIKHMDDRKHRTHTGASNRLALENLKKLGQYGIPMEIRMPIIPGINDAEDDILAAARFLAGIKGIRRVQLLPYHKLGQSKYPRLGKDYKLPDVEPPASDHMEEIAASFQPFGINVRIGE
ncbi:MAG: glycyl-radical enzyme activating protein [Desulfobacterales bacterium]